MCGIGAILDPAGTSGQHAAERMVEALRHRGEASATESAADAERIRAEGLA